jgi:3-isopropylmalate/(R)-2-methylmalate dehydratase small subunit
MKAFTDLTSVAVPLNIAKIDTGMILPGRFMRRHRRPGHDYAEAFLHDLRFDETGAPRLSFPLNQTIYRDAKILVTGPDFGCGSSREGAAYAVMDYGFRAMVGSSFADIFYNNCLQNGILPVVLSELIMREIWSALERMPGATMKIDLQNQLVIDPQGAAHPFDINPLRRERLMRGIDDIDATLTHRDEIAAFETERFKMFPWLPSSVRFQIEEQARE